MFGGGILQEGRAVLVSGTTDVLMLRWPAWVEDPSCTLSINNGMAQGSFLFGGAMGLSGGTLDRLAELLRVSPREVEDRIADLEPGSGGLLFLPGFTGERAPYWRERLTGSLIGLTLEHGTEHLLRAAMEGTAFRIRGHIPGDGHVLQGRLGARPGSG